MCNIQSVVMVLFRERHSFDEEQTAWELWHMRQHSFKQRVIDVGQSQARFPFKHNRLRCVCCVNENLALAFLAVFVYATHATQQLKRLRLRNRASVAC